MPYPIAFVSPPTRRVGASTAPGCVPARTCNPRRMPGSASRVGVDPVLLLDRDPGPRPALPPQLGRKLRHLGVQLGEAAQQVLGRLAGTDQPVVDAQDPQPGAGSM